MISERPKRILSEEISEDEERTVIFLEEGDESFAFRLFRTTEGAGDPEQRAIRWLGRAMALCRSPAGELRAAVIRSRDGTSVMATASGRKLEAKEWLEKTDDSSRLSTRQAAR